MLYTHTPCSPSQALSLKLLPQDVTILLFYSQQTLSCIPLQHLRLRSPAPAFTTESIQVDSPSTGSPIVQIAHIQCAQRETTKNSRCNRNNSDGPPPYIPSPGGRASTLQSNKSRSHALASTATQPHPRPHLCALVAYQCVDTNGPLGLASILSNTDIPSPHSVCMLNAYSLE
jgi:hypothetical protein